MAKEKADHDWLLCILLALIVLFILVIGGGMYYFFVTYNGEEIAENNLITVEENKTENDASIAEENKTEESYFDNEDLGNLDKEYVVIDLNTKNINKIDIEDFGVISEEGLVSIKKDGFVGYIDRTGKEVISCKYDSAGFFSEGMAAVLKNGMYGYIDKEGNEVVPCKYIKAGPYYSEGMVAIKKDGLWRIYR